LLALCRDALETEVAWDFTSQWEWGG